MPLRAARAPIAKWTGYHDARPGRAAQRFGGGGIGPVAGFGEGLAGNRQESRGAAAGDLAGGGVHPRAHQPHG